MTNSPHKEEIYDSIIYYAGKRIIMGVTRYTAKIIDHNISKTETFIPSDNRKVEPLHDMYDQVIIRMGGRAAQELSQLEISTEKFYNELKSAIPYMKNIALLEGKYFPDIIPEECEYLPEENYSIYIEAAKYMITETAKMNNMSAEVLLKNIAVRAKLSKDNKYN